MSWAAMADLPTEPGWAIIPSIGGWARMTGLNTISIDDRDPFAHGFVVKQGESSPDGKRCTEKTDRVRNAMILLIT
jgi:hypothetical protein